MSVHVIVDGAIRERVMQRRIEVAMEAADFSVKCFLQQLDRANRLEADLIRARRQNGELLRRIDQLTGYPERKLLEG